MSRSRTVEALCCSKRRGGAKHNQSALVPERHLLQVALEPSTLLE
jgi:hypothetical protein